MTTAGKSRAKDGRVYRVSGRAAPPHGLDQGGAGGEASAVVGAVAAAAVVVAAAAATAAAAAAATAAVVLPPLLLLLLPAALLLRPPVLLLLMLLPRMPQMVVMPLPLTCLLLVAWRSLLRARPAPALHGRVTPDPRPRERGPGTASTRSTSSLQL